MRLPVSASVGSPAAPAAAGPSPASAVPRRRGLHAAIAGTEIAITPTPSAYFGSGAVGKLPGILSGAGSDAAVVVTDAALAATPVVDSVAGVLEAAGIAVTVFSGVHLNPTTGDLAAGADAVATAFAGRSPVAAPGPAASGVAAPRPATSRVALVAVGGGSPIDAAKGIALAAVNPQRGRDLDYRGQFAHRALPIVAVPTTAGAAVDAVAGLAGRVGLTQRLADLGITSADFGRIAADALDDEVLANAPRQPTAADIRAILVASDQE